MARLLSKTGAEQQDVVQLLSDLVGETYIPYSDFVALSGTPAIAQVGTGNAAGFAFADAADEVVTAGISRDYHLPSLDDTKDISIYLNWSSASTSGDVVWTVSVVNTAVDGSLDQTGTSLSSTDTVNGTTNRLSETPVMTIPGGTIDTCCRIHIAVKRVGTSGSDTMTGDALLDGIRIVYSTNPNIV